MTKNNSFISSTGLLFGRLDLPIVYHLRINAMQNNMRVIYVPYITIYLDVTIEQDE